MCFEMGHSAGCLCDKSRESEMKKFRVDPIHYIIEKVTQYSETYSLTYHEEAMIEHLQLDIHTHDYTLDNSNGRYLLYRYNQPTRWLVLAHIDRIPVKPYTIRVENGFMHGQMDNVISVAICRYLIKRGFPADFMFTTQEETCQSADQIVEAYGKRNNCYVLDMDIDVPVDDKEVDNGAITLRSRDNIAPYDKELVKLMRAIAEKYKINYIKKNGHWLVCQIGTAIEKKADLKGMYLGLPIKNYHSNKEVVSLECVRNVLRLFEGIMADEVNAVLNL